MIGAIGTNYNAYVGGSYVSGATLGAARTALANGVSGSAVTPVEKTPEVYSNAETERVKKTPAENEKARNEAFDAMRFSTGRNAENINGINFKLPFEKELEKAGAKELADKTDPQERIKKQMGIEECETCANRKYVDGSNEADVSFKAPGHIDPSAAAGVVSAHEQMHVANARQEGAKENKELVSASVTLKTAVCPECGKTYVAGGETRTLIKTTTGDSKPSSDDKAVA